MNNKQNIIEKIILKIIQFKVRHWFNLEKKLQTRTKYINAIEDSPEKTWPNPDKIPMGGEIPFSMQNIKVIGKYLRSCIREGEYAVKSVDKNKKQIANSMTIEQLADFKEYAKSLGIDDIGFVKIPKQLIFKERAICYDNAIVLIKEMDENAIFKAPSIETLKSVFETYDTLGILTNKLTDYLRENNFYAQASHPLGGLVLYPPLAQKAGLGWLGKHGLLITPKFGAKQRISAIFTSIDNLPFNNDNKHEWIEQFCDICNKCLKKCPPGAIYEKPIIHHSKRETHIDRARCLPYFNENYGCSICLKECVFTKTNYNTIKMKFEKMKNV
jgi:Pyruvate/2-oxoacid:ferredoxin oxidoreductase delta subunit